jgi:hypothetical protein
VSKIRFEILSVGIAVLLYGGAAAAQSASLPAAAPVPPAIVHAKKIFVANAGADGGLFPHPFSGNPDRGYNQFYADLKTAGLWELVSSPSEADLVLELRLTAPYGPTNADKQKGASDPLPMFRLVIYDAGNHFVLWALTETIDPANLQKTHDHNFDEAVRAILTDFEALSGKAPAAVH